MSFEHLTRCMQLSDSEIAQGIETRDQAKRLLERISAISKPNDGAPKLLMVFARMASSACDWIDGELRIEVVGDTDACVVEMMSDLGGGLRERVFPAFVMNAPLFEFTRAVERVPHVIAPLVTRVKTERRIVFVASAEIRKTSLPPPHIEIDEGSLYVVPKAAAVPTFEKSVAMPPPRGTSAEREESADDLDDDWRLSEMPKPLK